MLPPEAAPQMCRSSVYTPHPDPSKETLPSCPAACDPHPYPTPHPFLHPGSCLDSDFISLGTDQSIFVGGGGGVEDFAKKKKITHSFVKKKK